MQRTAGDRGSLKDWARREDVGIISAMHVTRYLTGLLGAAVLFVVLSLAPSAAEAHAGHDAHAAPPASSDSIAAGEVSGHHAKPAIAAELVAPDGTSDAPCFGPCCTGASHACCGMLAPQGLNAHAFMVRSSGVISVSPSRSGLKPDALRKPPRTFA